METQESTGLTIRVAIGPAFHDTRIKWLGLYIRQAWRSASCLSNPIKLGE